MTADKCRPVVVDGQTVRVHGGAVMDDTARAHFAEIVRAARRRFEADSPCASGCRPSEGDVCGGPRCTP